jgi:hypothetical protein
MELYNVPKGSRIRVIEPEAPPPGGIAPEAKEYNFSHLDGMYSYCTDDDGNVVHLKAWTEVEIVDDAAD